MTTTNQATFTTQPMAKAYGWQGAKHARPAPSASSNIEAARTSEFVQGATESHDRGARAALNVIEGAVIGYAAGKAWSAWWRHQGQK